MWSIVSEILLWGTDSSFYQQDDGKSCVVKSEVSGKLPVLVNKKWSILSWQINLYYLVKCFQSTKFVS